MPTYFAFTVFAETIRLILEIDEYGTRLPILAVTCNVVGTSSPWTIWQFDPITNRLNQWVIANHKAQHSSCRIQAEMQKLYEVKVKIFIYFKQSHYP